MNNYNAFAQRFTDLIDQKTKELGKKPTQIEMAKAFDCDQSFISQMKRGLKLPAMDTALLMCDYFDCHLDWLMRGKGPKRSVNQMNVYELIDLTSLIQEQKETLKALIRTFGGA